MRKNLTFSILISLLLFMPNYYSFSKDEKKDDHSQLKHENSEDLKLGERLFYGLIITGNNTSNCASCHNTNVIDTFNWNPSAYEIAVSTENIDSAAFANSLLNPVTKRLSEAHKDIQLSPEQIILIRRYLSKIKNEGLEKPGILITRLIIFIFLIFIIIAAFVDLSFTRFIKFKPLHVIVIMICLGFTFKIIIEDAINLGRSEGYAPLQPIKFSHKVHSTENKIDCMYCHHTAETAKSAGIPSTHVCLNCHELVREGTNSGRFEIAKIISNMEKEEATRWIRIHKLPDHVFFSHAQHAGVGKLDCKECHGLVEEMDLAEQYSDLSMGWCLDCHRSKKVDFTGNAYYEKTFEEYHEQFKKRKLDSITIAEMGGENCMKCHY